MIIVTGAAGFIGSCLITKLNSKGFNAIVAVDKFHQPEKLKNLENKKIMKRIDRDDFMVWLDNNYQEVEFIFHIGARTDTTEVNKEVLWKLNTIYSQNLWEKCVSYQIPIVYASSNFFPVFLLLNPLSVLVFLRARSWPACVDVIVLPAILFQMVKEHPSLHRLQP